MSHEHRNQSSHPIVSRELSMLAFNARVLHEAQDQRIPLLDRFRFLGIVASNIDEFFGVRVSGIREQIDAGVRSPGADGRHLRNRCSQSVRRQAYWVKRSKRRGAA